MSHPHLDAYLPPAGFILVSSGMDGVAVYAPADVESDAAAIRTRCVKCGASLAFDPASSALHCHHCGNHEALESVSEDSVGEFTPEALTRGQTGWGVERPELHCEGCGAVLSLDAAQIAAQCAFCASPRVRRREAQESGLRPRFVLPFSMQREAAVEAVNSYLRTGWMRPKRANSQGSLVGVYLPFFLFDARMVGEYEVQVGKRRWVTKTDRNGNSRRETEIRWHWHQGTIQMASGPVWQSATTRLDGADSLRFPVSKLRAYTPEALVGFAAHGHDIPLAAAWRDARSEMRRRAKHAAEEDAGGDRQRHLEVQIDLQDEAWRYALMPVWVHSMVWGDRRWVVLVNGETGEVSGPRPVHWRKVYAAMVCLLAPGVLTGLCVGLPTLVLAGFGLLVWVVALGMLALGGAGALWIYGSALEEES